MRVTGKNGISFYRIPSDNPNVEYFEHMIFRGMTVDIPEIEAQRLLLGGDVVPAGAEVPHAGTLMDLPANASDVEIAAWVTTATDAEFGEALATYPHIADRMQQARADYLADVRAQNLHMGGDDLAITPLSPITEPVVPPVAVNGPVVATGAGPVHVTEGSPYGEPDVDVDDTELIEPLDVSAERVDPADVPVTSETDLDMLVRGSVGAIKDYLAEHPEDSSQVLDAEIRHRDGDVRPGVRKAVEVAAAHAGV